MLNQFVWILESKMDPFSMNEFVDKINIIDIMITRPGPRIEFTALICPTSDRLILWSEIYSFVCLF